VIRAICFDAFGTLVEITDKRQPFRALLRGGAKGISAEEVLTKPLNLREVAACVSQELGEGGLADLERDLQAECASVRLRPGIAERWQSLRERGLGIGVCSNLALPYGPPLLAALPDRPDAVILSYEVGVVKPDPAIFRLVCDRLSLKPAEILFVGDTPSADVEGPQAIGMPAMLIGEFEAYADREAVKAELERAFAAPEASYQPLTADEVIRRNSRQTSSDAPGTSVLTIRGSGLGPLVTLEEGKARLDEIAVDDDSTDWAASELLSGPMLAQRLQIALANLEAWRTRSKAIAFCNETGEYIYPVRQFEGAEPVEGLDQVVTFFPSQEEAWEWLVTPCRSTNDEAPIDRLRTKHVDEVVRAAEGANDFE
jgi:HAD superfamily hydrolase (TIGR01509 family)